MGSNRRKPARDLISVLLQGWRTVVALAVVCGAVALLICVLQKPVYEATTTLYVTSGTSQRPSTAYEDVMGSQNRANSYVRLAYSDAVLIPAVAAAGVEMDAATARSAVSAQLTPETVLLTIGARDHDPDVARRLADAVANAVTSRVASLEVPSGGGNPTSRLTVLDQADVDPSPVSPNTTIIVTLGVLFGLFAGVLTVLTRERFNNTVRDAVDVEKVTGAAPLVAIPFDPRLQDGKTLDFSQPTGVTVAAFRHLRSSLPKRKQQLRKIAVSGLREGDGTSTVAMNLAIALAESGEHVVVVDASAFDTQSSAANEHGKVLPGLVDAIRADTPLTNIVYRGPAEGLGTVGPGNFTRHNAAGALASRKCGAVLDALAERFRFVIIDSPPIIGHSGAEEIAQWCDGILLVVRQNHSKISHLGDSVDQLSDVSSELVGTILNDARRGRIRNEVSPTAGIAPPKPAPSKASADSPAKVPETTK